MMMTAVTQCETWKTSGTVIPAATPSTKTTRPNQLTQVLRLVVPRLTARHQNRGRSSMPGILAGQVCISCAPTYRLGTAVPLPATRDLQTTLIAA
jgi:hypothetical protein